MLVKSTHRAHCQVCGSVQSLLNDTIGLGNNPVSLHRDGTIAKHGYTVKGYGFFMGTCPGSGQRPLQHERKLTDSTCTDFLIKAVQQERLAQQLKDGVVTPREARTGGRVQKPGKDAWGNTRMRWEEEYGPFDQQAQYHQQSAIVAAYTQADKAAKAYRTYIKDMTALADTVYGTEPLPIKKK